MAAPASSLSLMDALYQRHSVRSYRADQPGRSTITALLSAAVQAPTGLDLESWAFVVVQDRHLIKRLSDLCKDSFLEQVRHDHLDQPNRSFEHIENTDFNLFYNANTLILLCTRTQDPFGVADCWLAAENLMLAACAHGLGSCVIGSSIAGLNSPQAMALLDIPDDHQVVAPIVVGLATCEGVPAPRQAPRVLAWK
jgi:nitroreductase